MKLTSDQQKQEEMFLTARTTGAYDKIWQTVGRCVFCGHDEVEKHHEIYEENGDFAVSIYVTRVHKYRTKCKNG